MQPYGFTWLGELSFLALSKQNSTEIVETETALHITIKRSAFSCSTYTLCPKKVDHQHQVMAITLAKPVGGPLFGDSVQPILK